MFKTKDEFTSYMYTVLRLFPTTHFDEMVIDDNLYEELFDVEPLIIHQMIPTFQTARQSIRIYSNYQHQVKQEAKRFNKQEN